MKNLTIIFLSFLALTTHAQDTSAIASDRPGQTFSATTLPAGHIQLQTGFLYTQTNLSGTTATDMRAQTTVRIALMENLEFGFNGDFFQYQTLESPGELPPIAQGQYITNFGFRYQLDQDPNNLLNLTAIGDLVSLDSEYKTMKPRLGLNFDYAITEAFHISSTGSVTHTDDYKNYGLTANFNYSKGTWLFFVEPYLVYNQTGALKLTTYYADAGVAWKPNAWMQIDAYLGSDAEGENPFASLGISLRIPYKKAASP